MYLAQALHEVFLKGGYGRATSDGDGCSTPVPEFLGNFERVLRYFCLLFLPYREYVRMRKDLIAKEKEAKLIPGQKVPSITGMLFASVDKHGSNGCFRELSRNSPTVSRNPCLSFIG